MNPDLIKRYYELLSRYPNLCFKIRNPKILDKFILGIVTNDGPICLEVDFSLYNEFDVRELPESYEFSSYINGDINLLSNLNLESVSYFDIKDDELYYYFGNVEEVIIPEQVRVVRSDCFKNNNRIKCVKGASVEEIYYYAFRNNINLEKLEFRKVTIISNLFNLPNLKEIIVGKSLSQIDIEDTISEKLKFIIGDGINDHTYIFDYDLDKTFLEKSSAIKENGEEISLAMISDYDRKFRFVKENQFDKYDDCFVGICKFEKLFDELPESLKQILKNYNYTFYIIKNFGYAGMCIHDEKILLFDMNNISSSFFHEVGHAIDFCLEKISSSDIFKNLYNEEKKFLYSNTNSRKMMFLYGKFLEHVIESEEEFFAESFNRYFEKDEYFYKECPKTYNFIENLMSQLNHNLDGAEMKQQPNLKK